MRGSIPIGLRAVLFGSYVAFANTTLADLVVSTGGDISALASGVGQNVVMTGMGHLAGSTDPATPWVMDGAVQGISIESPIVLTGVIKGTGTFDNVVFDGTFAPGHSPALVTVGNTIYTASNVLEMEIGGLLPGSQHDKIVHNGIAGLGGTLDVVLINAFAPQSGNAFDLFDWNASVSGTFAAINLPALASGLAWDTSDLYVGGQLSVVTSVPEVSGFLLMSVCLVTGLTAEALRRMLWRVRRGTAKRCAV
jgi:hypothetical protein